MTSYKQFAIGQTFSHWPGKTILESDNNLFSLLTMNHHPIHIDRSYAADSRQGEIVVVGTYVLSLTVGLTVRDISMEAVANLSYDNVEHLEPVFVGDTIYARSEIIDKRDCSPSSGYGIVTIQTIASKADSTDVIKFQRKILMKR